MKLTDAPGWPPWLDLQWNGRSITATVRVRLGTWRERFSFAAWVVRETDTLRWWERPLFVLWVVLFVPRGPP